MALVGRIQWNYSILNQFEDGGFYTSVPFEKDNEISTVLRYYMIDSVPFIRFIDRDGADQFLTLTVTDDEVAFAQGILFDYIIFEYNMYDSVNADYSDWINDVSSLNGPDEHSRSETCIEVTYEYNYYINSGNPNTSMTVVGYFTVLECYEFGYDTNLGTNVVLGNDCWYCDIDPPSTGDGNGNGTGNGSGSGNGSGNDDSSNDDSGPKESNDVLEELDLDNQEKLCAKFSRVDFVALQAYLNSLVIDCEGMSNANALMENAISLMTQQGDCSPSGIRDAMASLVADCGPFEMNVSCETYNFSDVGIFQISKIMGLGFAWFDPNNGDLKKCPYEYEILAPLSITYNDGSMDNTIYSISAGIAANAAANAHNEAINDVSELYSSLYGPPNSILGIDCNSVTSTFVDYFNSYFTIELESQARSFYNIHPGITFVGFDFGIPGGLPQTFIGFDPVFEHITATDPVMDMTIFGFFVDDCTQN